MTWADHIISLDERAPRHQEQMDDLGAGGAALDGALADLRWANRWLGGWASVRQALRPLVKASRAARAALRLVDLGTGGADLPARLVRWADGQGVPLKVVALDANPHAVAFARAWLDRRLPPYLRARIEVREGDALDLAFEEGAFDVALAALFLHHFDAAGAARLLGEMDRVATRGLVVSDLHRHPAAYLGVKALAKARPGTSAMFAHDAPLSVRRGYRRAELRALATRADLNGAAVRWRWAFRWVLSTV
ncbi:MAG: methyltransferase type 11 [Bacteroidetes bacterium QS_9_68_14]|nr:MAG: methyltransferase type 11 [Bacteroidetes bacterium QS_9_68_14]